MDDLPFYERYVLLWTLCPFMDALFSYGRFVLLWPLCPFIDALSFYGRFVLLWTLYLCLGIAAEGTALKTRERIGATARITGKRGCPSL